MTGAVRSRTTNLGLALLNFGFPNWGDDHNKNMQVIDIAFAILGLAISGSWENTTAYTAGQLLVDTDTDEVYRALVTHTSATSGTFAADRATNPTYWEEVSVNFSIRGEWQPTTAYLIGDIVYDVTQHLVAVCIVSHTSTTTLRVDEAAGKWDFVVDMKAAVDAAETSAAAAQAAAEIASGIVSGEIGPAIAGSPAKTGLVAADRIALADSENTFALSYTTFGNLQSVLQTAYDIVYAPVTHTHAQGDITGLAAALALLAPKASPTITGTLTAAIANFSGAVGFGSTVLLAADPTLALQAATKQYVDGLLANIGKRTTVRAATTANITIATALNNGDTLDGVVLATGNRVLVKNQTASEQNGIYEVGAVPARVADFDTYDEHPGSFIAVQEGTTNADTFWICTSNVGGTLNTTGITYSKFVITGELLAANNLSDVASAATAFSNIKQAASEIATGVVEKATTAEVRAGTADKFPDMAAILAGMDWFTLTDGATITVNHANGVNQQVTLAGNRTMASPTNAKPGWPLAIKITQDAGGTRIPSWASDFDFGDYGTPTLSTGAGHVDLLEFKCIASGKFAFLGMRKRID